jgi:hypothetical protein
MTENSKPTRSVGPFRWKRSKFANLESGANVMCYDQGVAVTAPDKETRVVVKAILEQSEASATTGLVGYRVTRCPAQLWAVVFNENPVSTRSDLVHLLATHGIDIEIKAKDISAVKSLSEFQRGDYLVVTE